MHAWQVTRLGEPADVMREVDLPAPAPQPGHVVVDVAATALNFPDVLMARGEYQVKPPLPYVPGVEVCGRVVEVGEGVSGVGVGDRVVGATAPPAGGLAERALMPATALFPAPGSLDDAEAAALTIGYQTAWVGLVRRAALRAGETLLVHAATGGVGSAAVQVGKALGARVIAVVGGADKAAVATAMGADVVLDRTAVELVPALKEAAGRGGVDVVFDPVGGAAYEASTKVVAFEGRIVVVGFAGGTIPAPALNHALIKNYSILGLHWNLYLGRDHALVEEAHRQLSAWAAEGRIAPLVSERLAFAEAADGLTRLAAGRTTGRLVVLAPQGERTPTG